jgi:predicted PurR-regulated permease PerM
MENSEHFDQEMQKRKGIPLFSRFPSAQRFSFFLLAIILTLFVLIEAKLFLYPIALAVLFAYLLYPIANFLEKHRFPRLLAILISVLIFLAIVGAVAVLIYKRVIGFIGDFPGFRDKALQNIDILEKQLGLLFGNIDVNIMAFLRTRVSGLFDASSDFLNRVFTTTTGTIFRLAVLPIFIFMFLYYRTKFAYFVLKLVPVEKQRIAVNALRGVSKVASRYMGGMSTVVIILCIINSIAFILIGVKYAIIFGFIAGLWSFIPYFGTIIGYSFPFFFSLLTSDAPQIALKILVAYLIVHLAENYILTPNIVGNAVKINAFVIILGMIAAGMVWGFPGMFVIVPFLAMAKVISEHVPTLHAYVYLLGTTGVRRHALTGENIRNFIHRMKARKLQKSEKS